MDQRTSESNNVVQLGDPRHPEDAADAAYEQVKPFLEPALDAVVAAAGKIIDAAPRTRHGVHLVRELIKEAFDRAGHIDVYPTSRPMPEEKPEGEGER